MKTNMIDTSLEAYESILPDLRNKQVVVLDVIVKRKSVTNEQIANHLNVGINTITPRTGELLELGLIRRGAKVKTNSNRSAYTYVPTFQ